MLPCPDDVVYLTRAASVQFTQPILFRVHRALDRDTYEGWCWLAGTEIDVWGRPVGARREVWVQPAGLRLVPPSARSERMRNAQRLVAVKGGNEHGRRGRSARPAGEREKGPDRPTVGPVGARQRVDG